MHGGDAARGNHTVVSPASGKGIKRHTFFSPPVDSSTATSPPLPEKMTEKRERKKGRKQNRTPLIFQTFVLLGLANFPGRSARAGSTPSQPTSATGRARFLLRPGRSIDTRPRRNRSSVGRRTAKSFHGPDWASQSDQASSSTSASVEMAKSPIHRGASCSISIRARPPSTAPATCLRYS